MHYVDQGIDTGSIIAQETVPVIQGDSAESLHARIQESERKIYPKAVGSHSAVVRSGRMAARPSGNEGEEKESAFALPRQPWIINPKTRVKQSSKKYSRPRSKRDVKQHE